MFTAKNSFVGLICAIGCIKKDLVKAQTSIQMINSLDFSKNEMVAVPVLQLKSFLTKNKEADLRIKDTKGKSLEKTISDYRKSFNSKGKINF
jgi:hypothetical protein